MLILLLLKGNALISKQAAYLSSRSLTGYPNIDLRRVIYAMEDLSQKGDVGEEDPPKY